MAEAAARPLERGKKGYRSGERVEERERERERGQQVLIADGREGGRGTKDWPHSRLTCSSPSSRPKRGLRKKGG